MGRFGDVKRFAALFLSLALMLSAPALASSGEPEDEALRSAGEAALTACVDAAMTDVETLTALHDWLALHCDYGATLRGGTAYGALVEGRANCVGYAAGLAYLASLAGLDGKATYSAEMDHAWILATLDGSRYFCDCTWDDGKNAKLGLIRHTYWLFDGQNAWQTGHYGWDSAEAVPGGSLEDAPWAEAVSRVIFRDGFAYYIDGQFRLWRCDRATWQTELLCALEDRWPDDDPADGKAPEIYSGLVLMGSTLFFNTPYALCAVGIEGGEPRVLHAPDTSERLLYGFGVRDGHLCYSLAEGPSDLRYEIVDTGLSARRAWGY